MDSIPSEDFVIGMMLAVSSPSYAGPLGIPLDPTPVMNAQTISSLFNAATGLFTSNGTAVGFDTGSGNVVIAQPFLLTAEMAFEIPIRHPRA